jgi:hypothetical protein
MFQINDNVKIIGTLASLYEGWKWIVRDIVCRNSRTFYVIFNSESNGTKWVQKDEIELSP